MRWKSPIQADLIEERLSEILEILKNWDQERKGALEILSADEAREILKCSGRTLGYHLYEEKSLPYFKIGRTIRVRTEDLKEFIEERLFNQQITKVLKNPH